MDAPAQRISSEKLRASAKLRAADVSPQWKTNSFGRSFRYSKARTEDSVGTEICLIQRAIKLAKDSIDAYLICCIVSSQRLRNRAINSGDSFRNAFATVACLLAVAKFHSLARAGRGSGRDSRTTMRSILQPNLNFDSGITAAVDDLSTADIYDNSHSSSCYQLLRCQP
jgi:hypothetical protein